MTRLGFGLALVTLGASILSAGPGTGDPARPRFSVAAPAGLSAAPNLQEILLRVPRRRKAPGRPQHRTPDPAIRANLHRRPLGRVGQSGRDARDAADAAGRQGRAVSDRRRATRRAVAGFDRRCSAYEAEHAGEPGRVTVRRLTSAEYAYAIRDLTGIDIKVGVDASSDSVGGEGFTNFGDVQFVQDTSIERYLEAAKLVADHAVIGAGPLEFYADAGKTGLELSALNRINDLYASKGFRVVSGEGGAAVRARALRQGVLRRLVLQAPRRARRSDARRFAGSRRRKASPAGSPITSGRW